MRENIDDNRIQQEKAHGKFLSENEPETLWNWNSPAGQLRLKRRIKMLTEAIKAEDKVLEIGCGTGGLTGYLAKTGAEITAIDISEELLAIAKTKHSAKNIIFRVENAYETGFADNQFDYIIGCSVLHHLDLNKALQEFQRILRPAGIVRFSEPNMVNPQICLQKNIPWLKRMLGDSPDETAFIRWSLKKKLLANHFYNIEITPFDFLHPGTPASLIPLVDGAGRLAEKVFIIREISGSLYVTAQKNSKEE